MESLLTAIMAFIENPEAWVVILDLAIQLLPPLVDYWLNKKNQSSVLRELKIEKNWSLQINLSKTVSHKIKD